MRTSCFRLLAIVCLYTLLTGFASAQTAGTGALTGTVTDVSGAVIPNVTVTAVNTATGLERTTVTGADGTYKFGLLTPGTYRVRFTAVGFRATEVPAVSVNVTETPVLDRSLEVAEFVDQLQLLRLLPGPHLAVSQGTDIGFLELAPLGHRDLNAKLLLHPSGAIARPLNSSDHQNAHGMFLFDSLQLLVPCSRSASALSVLSCRLIPRSVNR